MAIVLVNRQNFSVSQNRKVAHENFGLTRQTITAVDTMASLTKLTADTNMPIPRGTILGRHHSKFKIDLLKILNRGRTNRNLLNQCKTSTHFTALTANWSHSKKVAYIQESIKQIHAILRSRRDEITKLDTAATSRYDDLTQILDDLLKGRDETQTVHGTIGDPADVTSTGCQKKLPRELWLKIFELVAQFPKVIFASSATRSVDQGERSFILKKCLYLSEGGLDITNHSFDPLRYVSSLSRQVALTVRLPSERIETCLNTGVQAFINRDIDTIWYSDGWNNDKINRLGTDDGDKGFAHGLFYYL